MYLNYVVLKYIVANYLARNIHFTREEVNRPVNVHTNMVALNIIHHAFFHNCSK